MQGSTNTAHAVCENQGVDKVAVASAFCKASTHYDNYAQFQRDVGQRLLAKMPNDLSGKTVLDLGCGTGYFAEKLLARGASVICADLSPGMLLEAKQRCGEHKVTYLLADAEELPIESNSVDYVFSSLALQWCADLSNPLREIKRVIKSNEHRGSAFFSTLLDGSLSELKHAWASIDSYQHVNDFITSNQVKIALAQARCAEYELDCPTVTLWYQSAFELMRDLKGIGANHVVGRSQGLTSRKTFMQVEHAYQVFKNQFGLLPASYQVCLGVIHL
ncbi:malonyl-ACP O-methyltransferase BioC [Vibrio sp. S4M6]|uniref:malonyl-ACP O-methyltransferase BioC n=1 Tax=Vibrio sinus TaxID=2946865 RepID=UPI002029B5FB|nr:malonyl-ACP O-methyltransferase BioC [Vibrio sinus]MCL9782336.1 malonyl-ACP O-methyltransferase BioC [Vibrio sinus]